MTKQFNEVVHLLYEEYRSGYLKAFPGSNENDCERGFLHLMLASYRRGRVVEKLALDRIQSLIASIV